MTNQAEHIAAWSKRLLFTAAMAMALGPIASGQTPTKPAPAVAPAIDGILAAFDAHPLVAIGDEHGLAQEQDFYAVLLRDPRFAREVGNVVVEFGASAHQDIADRYVAGDDVPYAELRKIWSDVVGFVPTITSIGYMNVFAQVRATNLTLPSDQHIRVWLGEPPMDWAATTSRAQLIPYLRQRDVQPAMIIRDHILAAHRKALVIYGRGHLSQDWKPLDTSIAAAPGSEKTLKQIFADLASDSPTYRMMASGAAENTKANLEDVTPMLAALGQLQSITFRGADTMGAGVYDVKFRRGVLRTTLAIDAAKKVTHFSFRVLNLRDMVESDYPNTFFVISAYTGYAEKPCAERFESEIGLPESATLASPVRGTSLEPVLRRPGCHFLPDAVRAGLDFPASMSKGERERRADEILEPEEIEASGINSDALLLLGPSAELSRAPDNPDIYLDAAFRAEIYRRNQMMMGPRVTATPNIENYPASPRPWRP